MSATYNPNELLLPSLLGMDVYHRDQPGGLFSLVDGLAQVDGVQAPTDSGNSNIGFFAKAYEKDGTTYIVYRGTDDGSLDFGTNWLSILRSLSQGGAGHPDLFYGYPGAIGSLSSGAAVFSPLPDDNYKSQLIEAIRFYKEIKKNATGPVVIVGQSLGGMLAGFVGALYGKDTFLSNTGGHAVH